MASMEMERPLGGASVEEPFALLGVLIVHLNDAHHWTRERIAAWVADPDMPQDESHAHH